MPRFFIEVAYKGTHYAGFQKQDNANSIQSEVEKALATYFRQPLELTGSSRTDAGVHARQNFFHFDTDLPQLTAADASKTVYHLNAILPSDIVVKSIKQVAESAHSRFDAKSRTYKYSIYQFKDPFLKDIAFYYPYKTDINILNTLAQELLGHNDFQSFSKRNTQVHTFNCHIYTCEWSHQDGLLVYTVTANRFLRGMVKAMVGTMLKSAAKTDPLLHLKNVLVAKDATMANFAVPSHGLCLQKVSY